MSWQSVPTSPQATACVKAKTQRNKATSYHLGQLKAKLAKLKRELLTPGAGGGGGGAGIGFDVARTGIASVGFIGFPSVGKSSLMSGLTGTHSVAAAYEFTTLTTVPGTMDVHGASIQILDLPGIIEGAKDGKGRGRQVIAVARTCNLIFIVLDVLKPLADKAVIENELEGFGIRLNKTPPNITLKKKDKGGIAISNTVPLTKIDADEIKAVLGEYRMANCDVAIRCDPTLDEFIDAVEGNRIYIPCVYVLNKIDAISIEELDLLYKIPNSVPISAREWMNIDELIDTMWEKLDLVRVYTKPKGKQPDYTAPVVLKRGRCSIEDFCNAIHKEIAKQMKYAVVYGTSAKHSRGQRVGLDHVLADEDVVITPLAASINMSAQEDLIKACLHTTEHDIVPLTRQGVSEGCKVFGAAILNKTTLKPVMVATNDEKTSPLLHGEVNCIQKFYTQLSREQRPAMKDLVFFATHEPCSLCLSAITWAGFDNFTYLFTYEDTRDAFSIPYDIDILEQVFRVPSTNVAETTTDLSNRPLYNKSNKFFTSQSIADLIAGVQDAEQRQALQDKAQKVKDLYNGLSETYQGSKGGVGIPLA
ncbi:GTP-binding protein rbg1 [Microbotryomycetes sp. JL221]|nr:GTP-binding protein rbg1 [Microbotryomycetes sp. JL221]